MRLSSIALLLSLCACVSDAPFTNPDGSSAADTSTGTDSGGGTDTGMTVDTGVTMDTGTMPMDTGVDSGTCIPGTLAWWRAEDNALDELNLTNLSPYFNGNYIAGRVGKSFNIDSQTLLNLDASNAVQWSSATSFTITGWLNVKQPGAILQQNQSNQNVVLVSIATNKLHVKISSFDGDVHTSVLGNAWNFFAITCSGTTLNAWVGNIMQTTSVPSCGLGSGPFRIGRAIDATQQYVGFVDELSMYSRALSGMEIDRIYQLENAGAVACKQK